MAFSRRIDADLARPSAGLQAFRRLIAPCTDPELEQLAGRSVAVTRRHFGKTMRMFAPLYLSNECVNSCAYCGFSRENEAILRVTLEIEQVAAEARHLAAALHPERTLAVHLWSDPLKVGPFSGGSHVWKNGRLTQVSSLDESWRPEGPAPTEDQMESLGRFASEYAKSGRGVTGNPS